MSYLLASRLRCRAAFSPKWTNRFQPSRAIHSAKANFITLDGKGSLSTKQIDIFIGDPGQAYIMFNKDVGFAMKSAIAQQGAISLTSDPEKVPLTFFHDSRYFAHNTIPFPRINIERDLPRQNKTNMSSATLWLWGASHSITLDGTDDDKFVESSRESYYRLKGAADLLRDM